MTCVFLSSYPNVDEMTWHGMLQRKIFYEPLVYSIYFATNYYYACGMVHSLEFTN